MSVVKSTAYGVLDVPHHGEFTSCSLGWVYYTRNAEFPQNNLVAIKKRSEPMDSLLLLLHQLNILLSFVDCLLGFGVQVFKQSRNIFRRALQDGIEGVAHIAADGGPGGPGGFSFTVFQEGQTV